MSVNLLIWLYSDIPIDFIGNRYFFRFCWAHLTNKRDT